jgi:phosphatidylserine/phosphatidylglycerophosphate/cardiolipin synthase-like enzyme
MLLQRFDPPGLLDDFDEEQRAAWSDFISRRVDAAIQGRPDTLLNDGPRLQFFNPTRTEIGPDAAELPISWTAFPRQVQANSISDRQRWRRADASRDVQDEYCEWSVTRDPATNKILRVTFTCEGPEYWEFMARTNPDKVVELYRELIGPEVRREDLFDAAGTYNPRNRFNDSTSRGVAHLIQQANTLSAEIELAGGSTVRRVIGGRELTTAQELIECGRYGDPGRHSDPHIGAEVNALARRRADVTLQNPVGLYFHDLSVAGWEAPDGQDPKRFWRFVRGQEGFHVRAVYEVPAELGFTVGDIRINGRLIEFGAQIADFITIQLIGVATRFDQSTVAPMTGCRQRRPPGGGAESEEAVSPAEAVALAMAGRAFERRSIPGRPSGSETADPRAAALRALRVAAVPPPGRDAESMIEAAEAEELLDYEPLPAEALRPRDVAGPFIAYASPDSTFAVTRRLLDSAQHSIAIGIYDFTASHLKDLVKRAMQRGVRVSLLLDTNGGEEARLFRDLDRLGATAVVAPSASANSDFPYFSHAHEKIIVIDGEWTLIQSGNWSDNSIPFNERDGATDGGFFIPGNRDMGIAVRSTGLAAFFTELLQADMRRGLGEGESEAEAAPAAEAFAAEAEFMEAAPSQIPTPLFPSSTFTPSQLVRVTPVLTPDNYMSVVPGFLRSARRSIRIEQQYIRATQDTVEELLAAIRSARGEHPDLEVKIIVSAKYDSADQIRRFLEAMSRFGLEAETHIRFINLDFFVHCHNKLIVVDDERVLVGSQNWSTTAITINREASLLVEHAGIASYFGRIFDADWEMSAPEATEAAEAVFGRAEVFQPEAFASGLVVSSSRRDYEEV